MVIRRMISIRRHLTPPPPHGCKQLVGCPPSKARAPTAARPGDAPPQPVEGGAGALQKLFVALHELVARRSGPRQRLGAQAH